MTPLYSPGERDTIKRRGGGAAVLVKIPGPSTTKVPFTSKGLATMSWLLLRIKSISTFGRIMKAAGRV
jgi:hypothetical protein